MKLKNIKTDNELIVRLSFGAKESLDDRIEMYVRCLDATKGVKMKKSDVLESMIEQFIAEDKSFLKWMNENKELIGKIQEERHAQINKKNAKKKAKDPGTKTTDGDKKKEANGESVTSSTSKTSEDERRSETPLTPRPKAETESALSNNHSVM